MDNDFGYRLIICPRCGDVFFSNSKFPVCRSCEYEEIKIVCSYSEYNNINPSIQLKDKYDEELREKYAYSSPVFDKVLYNRRLQGLQEKAEAERMASAQLDREHPMCPKCYSRNTTIATQGFGMGKAAAGALLAGPVGALAGFAGSSKAKRMCMNCGHKW